MDYQGAIDLADDPWRAKLRDLSKGASILLISSHQKTRPPGRLSPDLERDAAGMLLAVLQARAIRRATWALVGSTVALVIVTGILTYATFIDAT